MNLGTLVANLPTKKAAIYTFDRGKQTRHPYSAMASEVAAAVADLRAWGVRAGSRVGIFAPNSVRWLIHDLAIIELGAVSVPFTEDFAGKIDRALLDKYQIALLLIAKNSPRMPAEKHPYIAYLDAENEGVCAIERAPAGNDGDDLTLAFSSGSAGGLKGLVISRRGVEKTLPPIIEAVGLKSSDRLMLFMPMSNFQQRNLCYSGLWYDFDIVITDYLQLPGAIKHLRPTVLIAPPMYFQMSYTRFVNLPPGRRALWTLLGKAISLLPVAALRRALAERAFAEFYKPFGGKMRILLTGMAPIKREVAEFFAMMQLPLCESYGLVETGSLTYRPAASAKYGSVGKVLRGIQLEFAEDGEVIVRRDDPLTKRYFQCADGENERTFIGGGRIATGDIGKLDGDGFLYLQGRKKELIITPGGYKIHPETVESELGDCPDIAQAAVFLKRGAATLVCVAALNEPGSEDAKARARQFVKTMQTTKAAQIGEIIFSDGVFSTENGMLRPNLKLDRRGIAAKYNI